MCFSSCAQQSLQAHAKSLWYQEDFKKGLTVSTCLRALVDAHRWLSQFWASSLLFVPLLGQNLLLNHSSGRGTRAAPSPKALCTSLPVPPVCCLHRTLQLHSVPAACVVGFAGFREAYHTQRGAICLNGSVGKDDCNNCRLLNMHVWRLIHVLHSKPNIQDRWLFLKIAWLLQNKQGNIDETAKAHLIPVL